MRIIVCVKAVPSTTEVKMDPVTNTIVRDGAQSVVNPFDSTALELALRIKDEREAAGEDVRVTVLSMGIPDTERLLRDCIARGADDGLLLSDRAFAGADTLATSYALSCGIRHLGEPDLVICGKMAVDGDTAQIGPEIAGLLDAPCVADVRRLVACDGTSLRAWRGTDAGAELVEAPLPAVMTVAKDAAQLRMPSICGVRASLAAPVEVLDVAGAGADPERCGLAGSPTQVVRSFVPERASGGAWIEGAATQQAEQLLQIVEGMGL